MKDYEAIKSECEALYKEIEELRAEVDRTAKHNDNAHRFCHVCGKARVYTRTLEDYYYFKKEIEVKAVKKYLEGVRDKINQICQSNAPITIDGLVLDK